MTDEKDLLSVISFPPMSQKVPDGYAPLNERSVLDFVDRIPPVRELLGSNRTGWQANEVGDGNLNQVFTVARIRFFVYVVIGIIARIAGIIHGTQIRVANPFDLVGTEPGLVRPTSTPRHHERATWP
jgi:hypothetical protein